MNPNEQPREDANNTNEPVMQFGAPEQFNAQTDVPTPSTSESDSTAPSTDSSESPASSEPQSFGQPSAVESTAPAPEVAPVAAAPQPAAHPENPGQTLGIVSIVLSFVGLSVVGIILGIISRKKSKEAGAPTTLGTVGLVIGIVGTVLAVLSFLFFVLVVAASMSTADSNGSLDDSYSSSYYSN